MIDCLIVTKPGFEWVSYLPYLVPIVSLVYGVRRWRRWERADKIVYILVTIGVYVVIWVLTFIFTPQGCAGFLD